MVSRNRFLAYLACFAVAGLCVGTVYWVVQWGAAVIGCRPAAPGSFLAYCDSPRYGDYEHGAYYLGLERAALDHLRGARAVLVGNSSAQFAYSAEPVRDYFRERGVPFYALGFGYGERSIFAQVLMDEQKVAPDVLIADASLFFFASPSSVALDLGVGARHFRVRHYLTRQRNLLLAAFSRMQLRICGLHAGICTGTFRAIHRSVEDGRWILRDVFIPADATSHTIDLSARQTIPAIYASAHRKSAEALMKAAGVRTECVVLTATPHARFDSSAYATELGALLGAHVVIPPADGIDTIDGVHMSLDSAARWSSALLRGADPVIAKCVKGDAARPHAARG